MPPRDRRGSPRRVPGARPPPPLPPSDELAAVRQASGPRGSPAARTIPPSGLSALSAVHRVPEGDRGARRPGGERNGGQHGHHVQAPPAVTRVHPPRRPAAVVPDDDPDAPSVELR